MTVEVNDEVKQRRKKTELVLSNIYNLPAMSTIMLEVSKLLDDPSTGTARLGQMIGKDQGLATKILSIANSPLYGLPRKVSTIDFAILIIGYQDIKNIVIALSMIESFKNKTDKNLNQKDFWLHSVICGNAAKRVAEDKKIKLTGEAFVSGLLHDLGIPVIHKYFHSSFEEIIRKVNEENYNYLDAEIETLGYTHQDIGGFLSKKWNLPIQLSEALMNHHNPLKEGSSNIQLTSLVHFADYMTQYLEIGKFYWDNSLELIPEAAKVLGFNSVAEAESFIDTYKSLFQEEAESMRF